MEHRTIKILLTAIAAFALGGVISVAGGVVTGAKGWFISLAVFGFGEVLTFIGTLVYLIWKE